MADPFEAMFGAPRAPVHQPRFAVHDACERDDVVSLEDLLGLNKPVEEPKGETASAKVEGGDEEMKDAAGDKGGDDEDDDEDDDKDFGGEEEEDDDDDDDEDSDDVENESNKLDARDDCGLTPLHVALLNGSLGCLNLLLREGADTGMGCEGNPLVHIAISVGALGHLSDFSVEALKAIMQHCGKLGSATITDDFRRTPLHLAADLGLLEIGQILVSALREAETDGTAEGTATLRDYLLSRDKLGNTCLHYACLRGHVSLVDLILDTAKSIKLGENESLETLLQTTKNYKKCLPLHYALREGQAKIAFKLLASPDARATASKAKDILGNTPISDCGAYGHALLQEKVTAFLSKGGADFDVTKEAAMVEIARQKAVGKNKTLLVRSDVCENHFTCRPANLTRGRFDSAPPENPNRLKVLTSPRHGGILTSNEFNSPSSKTYLWENDPPKAKISDVLRVHEWHYIRHVREVCECLSDNGNDVDGIGSLDGDTQLSRFTYDAAFVAAGASILAVDKVMEAAESGVTKVFCAVRPPGHHAGPTGAVSGGSTDPTIPMAGGSHSHGFCLLNNVAVAAAYAMNVYRKKVKRVALVDFDVHHGNGTEACVSNVTPSVLKQRMQIGGNDGSGTFAFEGFVRSHKFKPWFDEKDEEAILFASCQGYGESLPGHMFYPGTGATYDTRPPHSSDSEQTEFLVGDEASEFQYSGGSRPFLNGPRIVNVGIKGPKSERQLWKRAWRDKILPAVANHKPDLILISAGFDAHAKDDMNSGYIGLLECDYEWVTGELVKIANKHAEGRIVSVLEGGYRIQGGIVSPFARSVAAHVRALGSANFKEWSPAEAKKERDREIRLEQEKLRKQQEELQKLLEERQDVMTPAEAGAEGPSAVSPMEVTESSPKRRRRAASTIDYVALNAQLEKEAQEGKAKAAAGSNGSA